MNEKQLTAVKDYDFIKPLIQKIDSIIHNSIRNCHNRYFQTIECKCAYDIQLTNISDNEIIIITISDKSMGLYELKKLLTNAGQINFMLNQINKLTKKLIVV